MQLFFRVPDAGYQSGPLRRQGVAAGRGLACGMCMSTFASTALGTAGASISAGVCPYRAPRHTSPEGARGTCSALGRVPSTRRTISSSQSSRPSVQGMCSEFRAPSDCSASYLIAAGRGVADDTQTSASLSDSTDWPHALSLSSVVACRPHRTGGARSDGQAAVRRQEAFA